MRPFTLIAIAALLAMAVWHAASLYLGWSIHIGSWLVPMWLRWALLIFTAILPILLWRESFSLRQLMR